MEAWVRRMHTSTPLAKAGADAVKFQTHIAAAESTPQEPWRVRFSYQDASRYDYWKRMEFTEEQWAGLKRHADEKGCGISQLAVFAWKQRECCGESASRPGKWRPAKSRIRSCSITWSKRGFR